MFHLPAAYLAVRAPKLDGQLCMLLRNCSKMNVLHGLQSPKCAGMSRQG